jgi:hypothetical protein
VRARTDALVEFVLRLHRHGRKRSNAATELWRICTGVVSASGVGSL